MEGSVFSYSCVVPTFSFKWNKNIRSKYLTCSPIHCLQYCGNGCSYLPQVCQTFNRVCSRELTKAFVRVDRLHSQIQKNIKSQLPRKESERRNHALSRFVDVLSAMETRLSLLSMTYTKYIDLDLCCFIPGKVGLENFNDLRSIITINLFDSLLKIKSASWLSIFLHCIKFVIFVLIFYVFTFSHMIFVKFMQMLHQMETIFVLFISFCIKGSRNVLAKSRKSTEPVEGRTNPIQIMWLVLCWTHALTHWQTKRRT